jgi:Na+-translocating ferredoxin:NAD+ oxidoreductase RnfA subunit
MRAFSLIVLSSLSLNMILRFALGLRSVRDGMRRNHTICLFQVLVLFVSVFMLWPVFTYLFVPLGGLEYLLLFPCSVLACLGFERLRSRFFADFAPFALNEGCFSAGSAYNGLVLTALFLTLRLAASIGEALILSLGFSAGTLAVSHLFSAVHERSRFESVPPFLRNTPLMLIALGLMALVFSSLGLILLEWR